MGKAYEGGTHHDWKELNWELVLFPNNRDVLGLEA